MHAHQEWSHKAVFVTWIVQFLFCFVFQGPCLSLTTDHADNKAIALAITLVRRSWRANPILICDVTICDVICRYLLYDCEMWCIHELYIPQRFTTGVSGWIVIGVAKIAYFYYRCKTEEPDTYNIMGDKLWDDKLWNGNMHVEIYSLVKMIWKLSSLKMRKAPH